MATSAFKSTSRRGGAESKTQQSTANKRRSHSVSSVSRAAHNRQLDRSSSISSEFSFKRDNPLFSLDNEVEIEKEKDVNGGEIASVNSRFSSSSSSGRINGSSIVNEQRGRSVTRCSRGGGAVKSGIGRSLSRVRGRSASRGHYGGGVSLSEKVQDMDAQNRNVKKQTGNSVKKINSADTRGHVRNARPTAVPNQVTDWSEDDSACIFRIHNLDDSFRIHNLDDGVSIGSLSEAEEKLAATVPGQMKGFQGNNIRPTTATNAADVPPDLINPGDIELILDIRREYASKLEESEERARQLRADLAIEEHRGQELGRILKEIIPDPKTSSSQRSRRGRRTSSERKRISKRLTEEALAYFDECVSLSTFDSSDFSAPEDPSYPSGGIITDALSMQKSTSLNPLSSNDLSNGLRQQQVDKFKNEASVLGNHHTSFATSVKHQSRNFVHFKLCLTCMVNIMQPLHSSENSALTVCSSSDEPRNSQEYRFSFSHKQVEHGGTHQDIKSYIENFGRDTRIGIDSEGNRSYFDAGEYNFQGRIESVFCDRFLSSNRIESGSLLLCGGAISSSPFSPMI